MMKIVPLQPHQIEQAKQVVIAVCLEIWQGLLTEEEVKRFDPMSDIENARSHYFEKGGLFLSLMDGERIVGTGAIRKWDDEICELKRMWLLPEYRGQGWGRQMIQQLFDFARSAGYRKVRLDLADRDRQLQAFNFYQKLGFYPIERYNDGPCSFFMEKVLFQ